MTFYQYLMRFRAPKETDDVTQLANLVFRDSMFPRQSHSFDEISNYLEREAPFYFKLTVFDDIWADYQEEV